MNRVNDVIRAGSASGALRLLGVCLLLAAFSGSPVLGQPQPPADEPKVEDKAKPEVSEAQKVSDEARAKAEAQRKAAARSRVRSQGRRGVAFEMDPNAKWVCKEPTAKVDPIWRGDQNLTFSFDIKNEGTADLRFKARGG